MGAAQWQAYARVLRLLPPRYRVTRVVISERDYVPQLSMQAVMVQLTEAHENMCSLVNMADALGCANSTIQHIEVVRVNKTAWLQFPQARLSTTSRRSAAQQRSLLSSAASRARPSDASR